MDNIWEMLNNIKNLFKGKSSGRPMYDGNTWDAHEYGCPDCGTKPFKFYEGPTGGESQNICCTNPLCRSAFNMDGWGMFFQRISNSTFRSAFPECPEESEAYLKTEILGQLNDETNEFVRSIS